jgi:hydroxypyruvate reductase
VEHFDLGHLVMKGMPKRPPSRARVRLLAVGKAAPTMARAALAAWQGRIERGLVVVPDGTSADLSEPSLEAVRAGHPLPDLRSLEAAERAFALAEGSGGPLRTEAKDLLLVLVSGGASALLSAPAPPLTLEEKVVATRALLDSGAPISDINLVRRHLSRIKGGGLTRAAWPGRVLALVASDVIGGEIWDVGSGPTVPDPTTCDDAARALSRWTPTLVQRLPLRETLKPDEPAARRQRARVVAAPVDFAEEVARRLTKKGWVTRVLPPTNADVGNLAREYVSVSESMLAGTAWVRAAEPSVAVTHAEPGKGGRSTHLAALVGRDLSPEVVFLAGATDGVDGTSGLAGALVDEDFRQLGEGRIDAALLRFDSASLHVEAKTGIGLAPTGMNFADVHVLARRSRKR